MHPGGGILLITLLPATIFMTISYNSGGGGGDGSNNNNTIRIAFNHSSENGSINTGSNIREPKVIHLNLLNAPINNTLLTIHSEDPTDIKESMVVKKSVNLDIPSLPTCCDLRVKKIKDGQQVLGHCDDHNDGGGVPKESGVWSVPTNFLLRRQGARVFRLDTSPPHCHSPVQKTLQKSDVFLPNGLLKLQNEYYRTDEYCINGFKGPTTQLDVTICPIDCSNPTTPCIHKCCDWDEVYSLGMNGKRGGCLQLDPLLNETFWAPTFYEELDRKMTPSDQEQLRPHILHRNPGSFKPECPQKLTTVYPHGEEVVTFLNGMLKRGLRRLGFQLRKDGWLMHGNDTKGIAIYKDRRTEKYCVDGVQNYGEREAFQNLERQGVLFTCSVPDGEPTTKKGVSVPPITPPIAAVDNLPNLPVCCPLSPSSPSSNKDPHYCLQLHHQSNYTSSWTASAKFMSNVKPQTFSLRTTPLTCNSQSYKKAFLLNYDSLPGGGSPSLLPNGMLKFGPEYFQPGEYCVNGIFPTIVEVLMCKPDCSSAHTPCIHKCCAPEEVYNLGTDGSKRGCTPLNKGDTPWTPTLYTDMATPLSKEELQNMRPHLVQKFPPKFQYKCYKNTTLVFPFKKEAVPLLSPLAKIHLNFRLRRDGKVMYRHPIIKDGATGRLMESVFNNVEYCVDGVREGVNKGVYRPSGEEAVLFVCAMDPPS